MSGGVLVVAASAGELPRFSVRSGVRRAVTGMGADCRAPDLAGCGALVVAGTCGSLDPGLRGGALLLATAVVHGRQTLLPDATWTAALQAAASASGVALARGAITQATDVVDGDGARRALAEATGARAVDLESATLARAAAEAFVPWAVLRVVSDAPGDSLQWLLEMAGPQPTARSVMAGVLRRPWLLPRVIAVGGRVVAGTRRCSRVIGGAARLRA